METANFRFYAALNDFLAPEKRQRTFSYPFNPPVSVKHLIEAEGVPHPEVAWVLANGCPVGFSYLVQPGDRIAVYPRFRDLDLPASRQLQPLPPQPPGFVLDNHLGKLARYLRLLGFDTLYPREHLQDAQLAQLAHDQNRVMLTRDRRLLMRRLIIHGYCLRHTDPERQLVDVLAHFHLYDDLHPWRRCLRCNGLLRPVAKEEVIDRLEPKTRQYYNEFQMCQDCRQIYWQGSHQKALEQIINIATGTNRQNR